jgi:hypothetical protein
VVSATSDPSFCPPPLVVTKVTSCPFLAAFMANAAVTLSVPPFDCIRSKSVYSHTNNREVEKVL